MNWRFLAHGRLIILIGLYMLLSIGYNILFPLGRGNDEFAHFRYVQFIAQHHHLPVNQNERGEASYKSVHPPLYHALAASLFSWVDTQGAAFRPIKYGQIPSQSLIYEVMDIDWILPTDNLIYPYRGAVLLWHLSRFLSSLLTVATIAMTYFTVLELLPGKKTSALLAAAIIAFIPRFIISGSSVSDDSLVTLLIAVYLFLMVWLVKGQERWWHFMLIGITLGLALTTKFSIGLVPLTMTLFLCFLAWQRHWPVLTLVKRWALVAVTTSLVASWWFIFVIWNFNEIETQGLTVGLLNAVLPKIANATSGADVLAAVQGTKELVAKEPFSAWLLYLSKSFWTLSLPKWSDESAWTDPLPWTEAFPLAPQVFWASMSALILMMVGLGLTWRRADSFQRTWLGLFGLHILSFLPLMLVRYYMTGRILETAQGHHIILPAALAVAGLMMVGWSYWARPRPLRWLRPILPTLLLFWSIAQLYAIVHIFPKPLPLVVNSSPPPIETQINLPLLDSIELVGYSVHVQPDGSALEANLVWQAHNPTSKDYMTEVRLVNGAGQTVSSWIRHAADGLYPTRAWASGDVLYDRAELPLYNLEPGAYTLTAYLLEAYQRPAREAAGPLFSVPITLTGPSNYRPAYKQLPLETQAGLIQVNYQLWPFDFFNFSRPVYGYRAAIPIVWEANLSPASAQAVHLKLVGPDGQTFEPVGAAGNLQTFIVGPDWPAGMYRLKAEVAQNGEIVGENFSAPWLEVKNRARQFTPPASTHPVEANFYNHIKLLGYELPSNRLRPGQELSIFLHWQLLQTVNGNLQMFNHLYDANNQLKATFDRTLPPPFGGPIRWTPGQVITDGYTMPIEGLPDGIYTLRVGLYLGLGLDSWVPLPLINNGQVSELNYISLSPIKIGSAPKSVLALDRSPQHPRHDRLGGLIELSGYDLNYAPTTQDIHLTLYWKCLAALDKDYTTFVHLQDEHGQIIAQKDGPPTGGAYPTSLWEVNEVINDEIVLPVSPQVLTGNYELLVGMYELATGERLAGPGTGDNAIRLTLTDEFKR